MHRSILWVYLTFVILLNFLHWRAAGENLKPGGIERACVEAMQSNRSWVSLPKEIDWLIRDSKGALICGASGVQGSGDYAPERCIERLADGKTSIVFGAKLFLADRNGRFWITTRDKSGLLRCYDSTTKQWNETRLASADVPNAQDARKGRSARFDANGFEDSRGNLFFIGGIEGTGGKGIHRRDPQGNWTFTEIGDPKAYDPWIADRPQFYESLDGLVSIGSERAWHDPPDESCEIALFDGNQIEVIDPRVCRETYTKAIVPLPDGSIGAMCGHGTFWLWRKSPGQIDERKIQSWIDELANADPTVREAAASALTKSGANALPLLEKADAQQDLPPGAAHLLKAVIDTLRASKRGDHEATALHHGRYQFGNAYFMGRGLNGSVLIYADHVLDLREGKQLRGATLEYSKDGALHCRSAPGDQWIRAGFKTVPTGLFIDSRKQRWMNAGRLGPGYLLDSENNLQLLHSVGLMRGAAFLEDATGRVICGHSNEFLIYNPGGQPDSAALEEQCLNCSPLKFAAQERIGWAIDLAGGFQNVVRVGAAEKVELLTGPWPEEAYVGEVYALRNNSVVALVYADELGKDLREHAYLLSDNEWHSASNLYELLHSKPELFLTHAPAQFEAQESKARQLCIAGDGKNFWIEITRHIDKGRFGIPEICLEHYDGAAWHNFSADLLKARGVKEPVLLFAVDQGRRIVVYDQEHHKMLALEYHAGALKVEEVLDLSTNPRRPGGMSRPTLVQGAGEIWTVLGGPLNQPIRWKDGRLEIMEGKKMPSYIDALGRHWKTGNRLQVMQGDKTGALELGVDALTESSEGRLFALANEALIELRCDADENRLGISQINRWPWPHYRNYFPWSLIDAHQNLWLQGTPGVQIAIAIPR